MTDQEIELINRANSVSRENIAPTVLSRTMTKYERRRILYKAREKVRLDKRLMIKPSQP